MTQTEQKTNRWIDVNEHLPEEGEEVLACGYRNDGFGNCAMLMAAATFNPSRGWVCNYLGEIHYWVEMPELPLKARKED